MSDLRKAAKAVIHAWDDPVGMPALCRALDVLRDALVEPEQEPVAWMVYTLDGKSVCVTDNPADFTDQHKALPLYTAPPQRKPLTDVAIGDIYVQWDATPGVSHADFARAIEQAHGIVEE